MNRKLGLLCAILLIAGSIFAYIALPISNQSTNNPIHKFIDPDLLPKSNPKPIPTPLIINVPVLMYHYVRVVENPDTDKLGVSLSVTPLDFEQQMAYIANHGFTTITPDDLWQALNKQKTLPAKPIILTFDDGYADFYTQAWPLLKKYNLKATIYISTGFLNDEKQRYLTWTQLKELDQSPLITVGNHTINHINVAQSKNASQEITKSKSQLESYLGHEINTFAYPGGTFNEQAATMVESAGFTTAFTTVEGRDHRLSESLTLPRVRISGFMTLATYINRLNNIY